MLKIIIKIQTISSNKLSKNKTEVKIETEKTIKFIDEANFTDINLISTKNIIITTKRIEPSLLVFSKTTTKTLKSTTSSPKIAKIIKPKILNITVNGCFEVIDGYAMNSTAGGLEHDVSLEECQCFCANSL